MANILKPQTKDAPTVVPASYRLYAVVILSDSGQRIEVPVTQFNMKFDSDLGTVPSARIEIAIGVAADKNQKPSAIHDVVDKLDEFTFVEVYLEATGYYSKDNAWPPGIHLIWYGQIIAVKPKRSATSASISIDSAHWSKRLDYGAAISKSFIKSDLANLLVTPSLSLTADVAQQTVEVNAAAFGGLVGELLNRDGEAADLWYNAILPSLVLLALPFDSDRRNNESVFNEVLFQLQNNQCTVSDKAKAQFLANYGITLNKDGPYPGNAAALEILTGLPCRSESEMYLIRDRLTKEIGFRSPAERFIALTDSAQLSKKPDYSYHMNNSAEIPVADIPANLLLANPQLYNSIADAISRACWSSTGSQSILDKMLMLGPNFRLAFIPNVRSIATVALNATFHPTTIWRTLSRRDVLSFDSTVNFPGSVSGIVFIGVQPRSSTESDLFDKANSPGTALNPAAGNVEINSDSPLNINSAYIGSGNGQILLMQLPDWLQQLQTAGVSASDTDSRVDDVFKKTIISAKGEVLTAYKQMSCLLARAYWSHLHAMPKSMVVQTPLRLDIGPGSYIKLEGLDVPQSRFTSTTSVFYGCVSSVEVSIDAPSGRGTTLIALSHVRTDKDIDNEVFNYEHPMYSVQSRWIGCPLVRLTDSDLKPETDKIVFSRAQPESSDNTGFALLRPN